MPDEPRRFTFSIRDLFVATAVIGLLCAMLPMFLVETRTRGRTITCANNMRNVGMAMANYEATRRAFPGYVNTIGGHTASYVVPLMPSIERADIYRYWTDPNSRISEAMVYLDMLTCPSTRRQEKTSPWLSYVVNSGEASRENGADGVCFDQTKPKAPLVSLRYVVRHDGAANTIMLTENLQAEKWALPSSQEARRLTTFVWHKAEQIDPGWQINSAVASPAGSLTFQKLAYSLGISESPEATPAPVFNLTYARPSSNHPGGVHVEFCDGHLRFISEEIDYNVYRQLMTPNGAKSNDPVNKPLNELDY